MSSFQELVAQGAANAWLFIPTAILLGALHGLEPGHSKTMMAAFIIAIRGTVAQAVLLGLSAAFSHSLIIWLLAALALHYGSQWNAETTEPYLQVASAVLILGLAAWMFWRTRRDIQSAASHDHHHAAGDGPHGGQMLDTGHSWVEISVFETNVPPRFRLYFFESAQKPRPPGRAGHIAIDIVRPDGQCEHFDFNPRPDFLEATTELGEPHEFAATLRMAHHDHAHNFPFNFTEGHDHHHGHDEHHHHDHSHQHDHPHPHHSTDPEFQDAHERAHAADIERRFAGRSVTTGQIIFFGLTGGLLPCPASLTILLVCLQLKKFSLGFTLVLCFSLGLAATMVLTGTIAALSVRHAEKHFKGFGEIARKAPYLSCALLLLLGVYFAYAGLSHLPR
jgi:nickel/cobalt exporter